MAGLRLEDEVTVGAQVALAVAVRELKQAQRGAAVLAAGGWFRSPRAVARLGTFSNLPPMGAFLLVFAAADVRFTVGELEAALVAASVIRPGEWADVAMVGLPGAPRVGLVEGLSQEVYDTVNRTVGALERTVEAVGTSAERVGVGLEAAAESGLLEAAVVVGLGLALYLAWKVLA